jgi:hypothetical protein
MSLGYVDGVNHDYIPHCTMTLFAALDVATGAVIAKCKPRHRHQEFGIITQQAIRRGRARPPQDPRAVPRLRAIALNKLWSWDVTYQPTIVRGFWLYFYW